MSQSETTKLKGLAIILVAMFHLHYGIFGGTFLVDRGAGILAWFEKVQNYFDFRSPTLLWGLFFSIGWIGVQVFFILSGYGLTKKFLAADKLDLGSWLRQIWKLLVPYWIALPMTHIIMGILSRVQFELGRIPNAPDFFQMYRPEHYLQAFFVPTRWFSDAQAFGFNGIWWFIGTILQFYLLFPLLLWALKKLKPWRFLTAAIALTLIYRLIVAYATDNSPIGVNVTQPLFFINFPARLAEVALGMYFATRKDMYLFKYQTIVGLVMVPSGVLLASYQWGMAFSDFMIGFGLLLCFRRGLLILNKLGGRLIEWIGTRSYYIYLYHEPILSTVVRMLVNLPF